MQKPRVKLEWSGYHLLLTCGVGLRILSSARESSGVHGPLVMWDVREQQCFLVYRGTEEKAFPQYCAGVSLYNSLVPAQKWLGPSGDLDSRRALRAGATEVGSLCARCKGLWDTGRRGKTSQHPRASSSHLSPVSETRESATFSASPGLRPPSSWSTGHGLGTATQPGMRSAVCTTSDSGSGVRRPAEAEPQRLQGSLSLSCHFPRQVGPASPGEGR